MRRIALSLLALALTATAAPAAAADPPDAAAPRSPGLATHSFDPRFPTRTGMSAPTAPTAAAPAPAAPGPRASVPTMPSAATGDWTFVPRTWPVPAGGGALAFDAARGELLTFGGCCFHDQTWTFKEGGWTQHQPLLAPGGRAGNAMAYDPIREEVVMFGGSQHGETWTWDGAEWQIHVQPSGPQFRSDASLTWMPSIERVVMFGGYPDISPDQIGSQLEDTWTWDGEAWTRVATPTAPPARYGAGLAADPETGNLVLFGGLSDTYESLDDTWIFDGTTWTELETETTPPARSYVPLATNPSLGVVEMFSGYVLEQGLSPIDDRWFFTGEDWTRSLPGIEADPLPPPRIGAGYVHAAATSTMTLYGGTFCVPTCGGVWTQRLEETELPDGTIERRLVWDHLPPADPPDRMAAGTMVADPLGRGTMMFGGAGDSTSLGDDAGDTWFWKDGAWSPLTDADGVTPPGRQGPSLAVHRNSRTVVLFGGPIAYQTFDPRTWVLGPEGWEARQPETSPPERYHAGMAEDRNGNVVLFGGFPKGGTPKRSDTWVWDGETWAQHGGPGPSARSYAHMAYDPVRRETVLFGGSDAAGATSGETWVWDGEGWTQRTPAVSPPGRLGAAMAWDPASERMVLFAGATCANAACMIGSDVWTWDGETWSPEANPTGGPSARWFTLAGPDENGIVLFGGHGGGTGLPLADTWLWRRTA